MNEQVVLYRKTMFGISLGEESDLISFIRNVIESVLLINDEEENERNKILRYDGLYTLELIVKKRMKEVKWEVHSDIDHRWNKTGTCLVDSVFNVTEMQRWIEECQQKFGEVPIDCTHEAWNDYKD